jgi:hypothetical protein
MRNIDDMAKFRRLARSVAVAAFILPGSILGPSAVSRADGCDSLYNSQMGGCAGLTGVSHRDCADHAMACISNVSRAVTSKGKANQ